MKKLLSMLLVLMLAATAAVVPAVAETAAEHVIITSINDNPEQMDPGLNSYARSSRVLQNLFKGLYKLDADGTSYVPAMAESCEVSEDGMTYTFTLREGLKWSDGSPLTAHDFEYSWLRVLTPENASGCASDLWIIKNGEAYYNGECTADEVGVHATDDLTLVVEMETITPWFLSLTATTGFMPVCQAVVEANPNWTSDVSTYVSNGPFMLTEYSSLNRLVLSKNPNYYLADEVAIDEVQFVVIPDDATALTAYNNGEINVLTSLNLDATNQYSGTEEFHDVGKIGICYCDFNTTLPEFSDKRVRQAFAMAIDRQGLLDAIGSDSRPVFGFVPYAQPSLTDSSKSYREVAGDMFAEDVEAAQALMAEAGYPNGEGFPTVTLVCQNSTEQNLIAQVLGAFWQQNLGINYVIQPYESSVYWSELDNGNFSVDQNGYTVDYVDPSANLRIFITGSNAYENGWDDATYDQMYNDSLLLTDDAEREAAIIELEQYLVDQMPAIPLYAYDNQYLVKPNIEGVICNPIGHYYFEYASFTD